MYCPHCNHPILGSPESCPNCGKPLPTENDTAGTAAAADSPGAAPAAEQPIDKKTDPFIVWAAVLACTPLLVLVFSGLSMLAGVGSGAGTVLGGIASLFLLLCNLAIPAALVLSIMGFRRTKKPDSRYAGRGFALIVMIFSALLIILAIVAGVLICSKYDEFVSEGITRMNATADEVRQGIGAAEAKNRTSEKQNSFGTFFPEKLDDAEPGSRCSGDNPFFTEVLDEAMVLPVWLKGTTIHEYTLLDSMKYIYDPETGGFSRIRE